MSITLTKIGPGVFFALFGAFVMYSGITTKVELDSSASMSLTDLQTADTDDPVNLLSAEISKLPESPQKDKLLSLVNQTRDRRHFFGLHPS